MLTFMKNKKARSEPNNMPYPGLPAPVPAADTKKIADVPQMELFNDSEEEEKNPEYEKLKNSPDLVNKFVETLNITLRKLYNRKGFSPWVQKAWNDFCTQLLKEAVN